MRSLYPPYQDVGLFRGYVGMGVSFYGLGFRIWGFGFQDIALNMKNQRETRKLHGN